MTPQCQQCESVMGHQATTNLCWWLEPTRAQRFGFGRVRRNHKESIDADTIKFDIWILGGNHSMAGIIFIIGNSVRNTPSLTVQQLVNCVFWRSRSQNLGFSLCILALLGKSGHCFISEQIGKLHFSWLSPLPCGPSGLLSFYIAVSSCHEAIFYSY